MSALHTIDTLLGLAEIFLVPLSLVWLLLAWRRPNPERLRRASILALVLALTIAQPFGLVAEKSGPPPASAEQRDPAAIHVAYLFGVVPVEPFALYSRDDLLSGLAENVTSATLRARSWFWGPFLTNSTKVGDICNQSDVFDPPCWQPDRSQSGYAHTLSLSEDGGNYWATLHNVRTDPSVHAPAEFTWKLDWGLASPAGLIYWFLAGGLVYLARRRAQPGSRA
jgi:hypothetical protein